MITKFEPEKMVDVEYETGDWFWVPQCSSLCVLAGVDEHRYSFVFIDGQNWDGLHKTTEDAIKEAQNENFEYVGKACDVAKHIKFFVDNVST